MNDAGLREGWYLMSPRDVEIELRRWREEGASEPSNAVALTQAEAMSYRDAGNVPDELDRSLRLVLIVSSTEELLALDDKRLVHEPDVHQAPTWRRDGSRPINVVPLRRHGVAGPTLEAWTDDEDMARLESEWRATGRVRGIAVDAGIRGFVYKTVVALERAEREVTAASITDSLRRWLAPEDVERVRAGLDPPRDER